jgi:hypothetical protein
VLVESVVTPKGPRQKTICSLGDLSPRPREEWLELARKIEDALVGQGNLLGSDDDEVAERSEANPVVALGRGVVARHVDNGHKS